MKEYIIAGNWKMYKTIKESVFFFKELNNKLKIFSDFEESKIEVLIFAPFTSLYPAMEISNKIKVGAQNFYFESKGAFTGEISPLKF